MKDTTQWDYSTAAIMNSDVMPKAEYTLLCKQESTSLMKWEKASARFKIGRIS